MQVTLVFSPAPRQVEETTLVLEGGATVAQALQTSGWLKRFPELSQVFRGGGDITVGIWGKKALLDTVLREKDRIEFYRGLRVDPKVARRERFNKQGARGTGLFAQRRPGAKPGY
jgi:putative ubiquitin-RnfH superfamily antitoxin RatB of RatAB toxin-antitoxin module